MNHMDNSPSPARWFRVLKRSMTGESRSRKPSTFSLCEEILKTLRESFSSGRTRPYSFRISQLEAILEMLEKHEMEIVGALEKDMSRPKFETVFCEITMIKNEALYAIKNLESWMQHEPVKKNMISFLDNCFVRKEPVGVVLVIGGSSFPVQLSLIPVIGAVAAGNCVILKPSETSSHIMDLLHTIFPLYLDNSCYHLLSGGHIELLEILENKFDYIFYTGCTMTGRQVMQAAAKHITPVSLVLGGKNPCYVDKTCDLPQAARRIAWARFMNAGQNSMAPEYILCHPETRDNLIHALGCCVQEFYGNNPKESLHYGRIASIEQYKKVKDFLCCGHVAFGGETDDGERYIAPTVLTNVKESDPVMQQEILGPVLPVLTIQTLEEAIDLINKKGRPLAIYVYSDNPQVICEIMERTCSGSFCSNDSMIQSLYTGLPCGGIGNSGVGIYGGKYSFDTFSHSRACLLRSNAVECITYLRYPPYAEKQLMLLKWASTLSKKNTWCQIL
ncbi:aldehyde dehydrogenase family 3 member B1-like [Bombina bombina]|uniref:aldehyde dehydrogenase family 3 member B1-like n=1 Tax=Bombina bombina TaxID=8345 RepID=UPI00235A9ED0|nr:aldehyde dehydrogenase family 3 member B1-like [Bombina bombina]